MRPRVLIAGTAILAVTAALAIPESGTLAAFVDPEYAGSPFNVSTFGIEGSVTPGGADGYADHATATSPATMVGSTAPGTVAFTSSIALSPGQTAYAPLHLRATTGSSAPSITMSAAAQRSSPASDAGLWGSGTTTGAITYGVRVVDRSVSTTCSSTTFSSNQGAVLLTPGSRMTAPPATFTLPAATANAPGTARMVCFAFSLASNAATTVPASNGKAIYPYWTFTGRSS